MNSTPSPFMEEELQMLLTAVAMRANWIETGNIVLSAEDVVRMGEKARVLSDEQVRLIAQLRALMEKLLRMESMDLQIGDARRR